LGSNRSRLVRAGGRDGIDRYAEFVTLEADDPDAFEQLAYWRPLSRIVTFSLIQTPVRTRRTSDGIRDYPSNFLIVATQTMGKTIGWANGHEFRSAPGQMTFTDSRLPYDLTTHGVTDSAGIWVPTEMLGIHIDSRIKRDTERCHTIGLATQSTVARVVTLLAIFCARWCVFQCSRDAISRNAV